MAVYGGLVIPSLVFCVMYLPSCSVAKEVSINLPNGGKYILDGYVAHDEFYEALQDNIGNKISTAVESLLSHSKVDVGQLLENINADEYTFLQILHSLARADSVFTSQLLQLYSHRISVRQFRQPIMSDWLRKDLKFPLDKMYNIARSIVSQENIGRKIIPMPVINEVFEMMDRPAVFMKASEEGDIDVMNWLLESVSNSQVNMALNIAWWQERNDIVKMLISNNATLENNILLNITNSNNESLLHIAAEVKNPQFVTKLLQLGVSVNGLDVNGTSPLYRAVQNNDIATTKLLLERGANVNCETVTGNIALHAAAKNGNLAIVNLLIESDNKVIDKQNRHGASPLMIAEKLTILSVIHNLVIKNVMIPQESDFDLNFVYSIGFPIDNGCPSEEQAIDLNFILQNSEIVKNLHMRGGRLFIRENIKSKLLKMALKSGLDTLPQSLINAGAQLNPTLHETKEVMFSVIEKGNKDLITLMLNEGMSANTKVANGTTALHVAAHSANLDILHLLLKRGGNMTAVTRVNQNLLHAAAGGGKVQTVKYLLSKGLNINAKDKSGNTPLIVAVDACQTDVVRVLLEEGANFEKSSSNGFTELHLAAKRGSAEIVNLLINKGADINAQTDEKETPLFEAAHYGKAETVAALIERGAKIDIAIFTGINALHAASQLGHLDVVRILLDKGLDINALSSFGVSALHLAVGSQNVEVTEFLINRGADIDIQDSSGQTPLHRAVDIKSLKMVNVLLNKGCKVNVSDKNGKTPLDIAVAKCNRSLINVLLEKGGTATSILDTKCI